MEARTTGFSHGALHDCAERKLGARGKRAQGARLHGDASMSRRRDASNALERAVQVAMLSWERYRVCNHQPDMATRGTHRSKVR
jgi:hypothetical protein